MSTYGTCLGSAIGFGVTATSLFLALIPGKEVEKLSRFYAMVFGALALNLAIGTGLYLLGKRSRSRDTAAT